MMLVLLMALDWLLGVYLSLYTSRLVWSISWVLARRGEFGRRSLLGG